MKLLLGILVFLSFSSAFGRGLVEFHDGQSQTVTVHYGATTPDYANVYLTGDAAKALLDLLLSNPKNESGEEKGAAYTFKWARGTTISCSSTISSKGNIYYCNFGVDQDGAARKPYPIPKGGGSVGN